MISLFFQKSKQNSGFSLTEILVSVAISACIIVGVTVFVVRLNGDIAVSSARSGIHLDMARFMQKIREARHIYADAIILNDGSSAYGTIVLTNSGRTAGVLVGVTNITPGYSQSGFLDSVSNFPIYGRKVFSVTPLSWSQVSSLITSPSTATGIAIFPDSQFLDLNVARFQAVLYNSGTIVDSKIVLYEGFFPDLSGTPTDLIPQDNPIAYAFDF